MRGVEDDEEAQKRGVVGCVYCVDGDLDINPQMVRKTANLRNALPFRFISAHVCYNNPRMLPFFSLAMVVMGTYNRMRFRAHYGSHEECQCQLSSFGIPQSALPMNSRGEFNLEHQRTFMAIEATKSKGTGPLGVVQKPEEKARSRQPITREDVFVAAPQPNLDEGLMGFSNFGFLPLPMFANRWWSVVGAPFTAPPGVPHQTHISGPPTMSASRPPATLRESSTKPYVIYDPLPNDILLGRGKPIQERPGNVRFRDMLDKNMDKYDQGVTGAKTKVSAYIVHMVKEEGGRFLKELQDGGWVEIDETTARKRVSHAFRARRGVFQATLKKDKSTA
jgi:hypothetical protein